MLISTIYILEIRCIDILSYLIIIFYNAFIINIAKINNQCIKVLGFEMNFYQVQAKTIKLSQKSC